MRLKNGIKKYKLLMLLHKLMIKKIKVTIKGNFKKAKIISKIRKFSLIRDLNLLNYHLLHLHMILE
jgi:hypothetical protein